MFAAYFVFFSALVSQGEDKARANERTPIEMEVAAPEIEGATDWIHDDPITFKKLRGKVVVFHFWTFGCINCKNNYEHYRGWTKDFGDHEKFHMLGVHTPEFDHERDVENIREQMKEHDLEFPVAVDNDWKLWKAWGNRYWPCVYLIDKRGRVRYRWDGELNYDGATGEKQMRERIEALLAEPDPEEED